MIEAEKIAKGTTPAPAVKPHCSTCGKDVAEVLCKTCGKWWADNAPPAPTDEIVAKVVQKVETALWFAERNNNTKALWLSADEWRTILSRLVAEIDATLKTTPAPAVSTDDAIEQIVVGFSDKAILRLDIEEDDPRLSRVCDDMRQTVRAILSRLRGEGE